MSLLAQGLPDWRDEAAYASLRGVERAAFAWEWLRRDPAYRAAAAAGALRSGSGGMPGPAEDAAAHWGLHAFENPDLGAVDARPVWRKEAHPPVLEAFATPWQDDADALSLGRLGCRPVVVRSRRQEHLLLSDGYRSIRLDISGVSLLSGPVRLSYGMSGFEALEAPLLTLRRLLTFMRHGRFSRVLHAPETRAERIILMLRADDASREGASQREIAAVLLSGEARDQRWRISAPSLRSRAQRLVRAARESRQGYRIFLS